MPHALEIERIAALGGLLCIIQCGYGIGSANELRAWRSPTELCQLEFPVTC